MADIESIGRTALLVSELRAQEAEQVSKLFDDPYARLFLSPESKEMARRAQEAMGPMLSVSLRVRVRWFDDFLQRELERGTRQVLLLGAGMDCRALRFPRAGTTYFEVDSPNVLAYKAERLAAAGHASSAVAVGTDYLAPGLFDQLAARGFDRGCSTVVLWEGNTYYLPQDKVREVLRLLSESIAELRVAFDYVGMAAVQARSQKAAMNQAVTAIRKMGAPVQAGIDDVEALAREVGLKVLENIPFAELVKRWLPEQDLRGEAAEATICVLSRAP